MKEGRDEKPDVMQAEWWKRKMGKGKEEGYLFSIKSTSVFFVPHPASPTSTQLTPPRRCSSSAVHITDAECDARFEKHFAK